MILLDLAGPAWEVVVVTALGLIFGSFANVCIHRLPDRRSVVWPGSACSSCGAPIGWYDNIPILSWLVLGGKCRSCRGSISLLYPLVEAAAAALLLALYARHGLGLRWAALSYLVLSILVLVPIDFRHGILPDRVTLPGIAVGLAHSFFTTAPGPFGSAAGALVGALVPLGIRALYMLYARARSARQEGAAGLAQTEPLDDAEMEAEAELAAQRREGMGLGDVKMLAMVGAFLGVPMVLLTMLLGSVIGTLYVLPMLLLGRHTLKTPLPFGPFLGAGAILCIFWGPPIIEWYTGLLVSVH